MTVSGSDEIELFLETEGQRDWCLVCLRDDGFGYFGDLASAAEFFGTTYGGLRDMLEKGMNPGIKFMDLGRGDN